MPTRHRCRNGTTIVRDDTGTMIIMPDGRVIWGAPHDTDSYRATAERLGYGADTLAMCLDHDPLHALLCDWLRLPESYSLRQAVEPTDKRATLAELEEDAVLAIQKFMRAAGARLPL